MREMIDYRDYLIRTLASPEEAIGYFQASDRRVPERR